LSDLYILQLASQNARWLSQRETLIAGNVANASTPGYRALDLVPFSKVLDTARIGMTTTNAAHLIPASGGSDETNQVEAAPSEETLSGNSVNIERQMMNLGDVNRSYALNTNVTRAFHQMILSVSK
jgi:flagellar basal-body rod protein FlgB